MTNSARITISAGFRKAISCHYANADLCKYIDIRGTTQEELSLEIADIARKKMERYFSFHLGNA